MLSVLKSAIQVGLQKLPLKADVEALVVWCDGIGDMITFRNHMLPVFNICSTPLRAVFDPAYQAQALKQRSKLQSLLYGVFSNVFRQVDRLAWRHYSGVIATSKEVRGRILAGRLFKPEHMALCYPGIEWKADLLATVYEPFVLVAGRIMWTKNIEFAIQAFQAARLPKPWKLVVAGYLDQKSVGYLAYLRRIAGSGGQIEFILSPSDEILGDLLQRASFCLFPPLNEDWGLVPLEAMSRGKPVIATDSGGPKESIIDGETGYLLPPVVAEWASKIAVLAGDPGLTRRLGTQAHAHVAQFSWDRFVTQIDDLIEQWLETERAAAAGDARPTARMRSTSWWPA